MAASSHRCFSRQTLVDFQIGKLSQDRITQVYAEISACPDCRRQLEALENVADPMLAALQGLAGDAHSTNEFDETTSDECG